MAEKFRPKQPYFFYYSSLERMREAYKDGVVPALYDAICYYRLYVQPLGHPGPDWIWDGVMDVMNDRLRSGKVIGKGKTGNETAKYQNDMKHLYRYEAVKAAREGGLKLSEAYDKVSKMLTGSFAVGLPVQMKKSYNLVRRALKTDAGKKRFYLAKYPPPSVTGL